MTKINKGKMTKWINAKWQNEFRQNDKMNKCKMTKIDKCKMTKWIISKWQNDKMN